jgi:hypothetical protein
LYGLGEGNDVEAAYELLHMPVEILRVALIRK